MSPPPVDLASEGAVEPVNLAAAAPFRLGGLEIRPSMRQVRAGAKAVIAEPRVLQVLIALAEADGAVVSREDLVRRCWEGRIISEDAINRSIAKARSIAELTEPPAFAIETIPRVGYRLIAANTEPGATADDRAPTPISPGGVGGRRTGIRLNPRPAVLTMAAGMILAVLAVVAVRLLPARGPSAPDPQRPPAKLRVAAPPLNVLGDPQPELGKFVGGLQAEMVNRLNRSQVDVASPDPAAAKGGQPGAAYAFGGAVERDGRDLVVHLHLDDVRQHLTVWSDVFRQPADHADILRGAAASEAAVVADAALNADRIANGDAEIVALMIKANRFARRDIQSDREDEWENQKLLLAKLPRLAWAHSDMAVISAFLATTSPARAPELKAESEAEADAALKIDPHDGLAYLARTLNYPLVGHWREREAGLLAGLNASPSNVALQDHESNFLRQVGRLQDAVTWGRLTAAHRPDDITDATLLLALGVAQQSGEAAGFAKTVAQAWPAHSAVWNARLQVMIYQSRWSNAAKLFAPGAYRPYEITEAEAEAWRGALKAMESGNEAARLSAARALAAVQTRPNFITLAPYETYAPGERIGMLAILGATDEAFREAAAYLKPGAYADSAFLFWPNLTGFRRDPRFARLVTDMGLVAYWKTANAWPDFCGDPDLPYKCKTLPAR